MERHTKIAIGLLGAAILLISVFLDIILYGAFGRFGYIQFTGVLLGVLLIGIAASWRYFRPIVVSVAKNLPVIVVSILVTLLLIEITLRQFYFPVAAPSDFRKPDPVLGWRLEPNGRINNQTIEFTVPVEYNSRGWRDIEHSIEKPAGTYRILVLGDSFMEAYSVALDDTFYRQLQELVEESSSTKAEIINLGVGGYGTLQEYLTFVEEGRLYDADLVLLGFYTTNDVRDNSLLIESESSEQFKINSRPYLLPGNDDTWEIRVTDYQAALEEYEEIKRAKGNAPWYSLSNTAISRLVAEVRLRRNAGQLTSSDAVLDQNLHYWIGVNRCEPTGDYVEGWEITRRVFSRLNQEVQESGAQLVVFTVPGLHEVDESYMARVEALDVRQDYCLEELPGNEMLRSILSDEDIPLIDLVTPFREETGEAGVDLFRWTDQHWNEAGHSLAAEQVFEYLIETDLLPR